MNDDFFDQMPFGEDNFADNPEPRCPCLLILDTSGSMQGSPINELNSGLSTYKEELSSDSIAMKRVETAILTFGPPSVENTFTTAENFSPPTLRASGATPMGEAIIQGLEMVKQRKDEYRQNGISFYRPWVFLITDGGPTDDWHNAAAMVQEGERSKAFSFFAVGVGGANMDILQQICVREPLSLQGLQFKELFVWLSNSMKSVSQSSPSDTVKLVDPTQGPNGWAEV